MAILSYKWLFSLLMVCAVPDKPAPIAPHPLYVSVTDIRHNAVEKTLEVSVKIFTDDFEKTLAAFYQKKVDLSAPVNREEADKMVSDYIRKHLLLQPDGKTVTMEFVGFEKEKDVIWSYFQVNNVATPPKKFGIKNNLLYETYDTQINLIHVTAGTNRKSTRLDNPNTDATIEF